MADLSAGLTKVVIASLKKSKNKDIRRATALLMCACYLFWFSFSYILGKRPSNKCNLRLAERLSIIIVCYFCYGVYLETSFILQVFSKTFVSF